MNETHYIYAITDPDKTEVRYVGRTKYPAKRLSDHCSRKCGLVMWRWVVSIRPEKPQMIILEQCSAEQAEDREHFWINVYKAVGANLLNHFGVKTKPRVNEAYHG